MLAALALLIAVGGGAASAWLAARSLDPVSSGPGWHALPDRAARASNPYRRDPAGRRFALGAKAGEKLLLVATQSDSGAPLRSDCTYRLSGRMPPSRIWTIAALDTSLASPGASPAGLSSTGAVWHPDGSITISMGFEPAPGNWLRLSGEARPFVLLVGLYDTPSVDSGVLNDLPLLAIRREACRDMPQ